MGISTGPQDIFSGRFLSSLLIRRTGGWGFPLVHRTFYRSLFVNMTGLMDWWMGVSTGPHDILPVTFCQHYWTDELVDGDFHRSTGQFTSNFL